LHKINFITVKANSHTRSKERFTVGRNKNFCLELNIEEPQIQTEKSAIEEKIAASKITC